MAVLALKPDFLVSYVFKNQRLLEQALTHSSFVFERKLGQNASNQRLEFLGDAVLELLVSDLLYKSYPKLSEGELSKCRANIVCEPSLAGYARRLGLGKYLRLSRGEAASGGAEKDSILCDAFEALIGAIFLDAQESAKGTGIDYAGLEAARKFLENLMGDNFIKSETIPDPKSDLQESLQKKSRIPVIYTLINECGPAHKKEFTVEVSHKGRILGRGTGKSKKDAESNAAIEAIKKLGISH